MWSSRLFWKLFSSYTVLNFVATIVLVMIVSGWQQDQIVEQIKHRLHDSAALIRSEVGGQLNSGPDEQLQLRIRTLSREIGTRVTLVNVNGKVLADSNHESLDEVRQMENHKDRVELVQASAHGQGSSERISPTLGEPMLYMALRIDRDSTPVGLVRTAVPMTTVLAQVAAVRRLIWLVGLLVCGAVAALTYALAARVVQPVRTLTEAAESIAAGEYGQRVFLQDRDELGILAKAFNRMTRQLDIREAQLRESSRRLSTVLEGMVEGVLALDDRERIVLANAAAGRLLDFQPLQVEGRPLLEVVRNRAVHEAINQSAARAAQAVEVEIGEPDSRVIRIHATLLTSESTTRCIVVLHDETELRRLESLRQEFVANVSHELKTPLSSIKAYSETLLNGAISDERNNRRFVERISDQAELLHELIMDLLSIARIESGQQTFDIGAVPLEATVQSCIAAHQAAADAKSIQLTTELFSAELAVSADEEGLRQILNNLISNAIKYTPESGAVSVVCRVRDAVAVVEVHDTGIGIEQQHLPRVFERFFRVDKARSREMGGTGLGLSIVKHLAQSFGGSVEVSSTPGEGSVFTVLLPTAQSTSVQDPGPLK